MPEIVKIFVLREFRGAPVKKDTLYITNYEDPKELFSHEDAMGCAHHAYILLYDK